MNELIQTAFSPVNLVYTFLLILIIIYWLTIIVGVLDFGSFDVDFDLDADVDINAEVSSEVDTGGPGNLVEILHFFNFGKLPFMVIMSFVILSSWAISVLVNHYLGNGSIPFAVALLFPNIFVSLCLTKIISTPLIPVFQKMEDGIEPVDYIGMTCKMILPATNSKMGQAEVLINNSPLLVNVKVDSESNDDIEKGGQAIILRKEKNKSYYIIKRINDEDI